VAALALSTESDHGRCRGTGAVGRCWQGGLSSERNSLGRRWLGWPMHQPRTCQHRRQKQKPQRYVRSTDSVTTKASHLRKWNCCHRDSQGHPPACSSAKEQGKADGRGTIAQGKADAHCPLHFGRCSHRNWISCAEL